MNSTTTPIDPSGRAIGEALYYVLFRVAAIADLEGPVKAVEWAQSVLDDDRLRAALVAGIVSNESRRRGEKPTGADAGLSPTAGPRPRAGGPLRSSHAGHPRQTSPGKTPRR
jgi:hypothetical protein